MFSQESSNNHGSLLRLAFLTLCFILQFRSSQQGFNAIPVKEDFATSKLSMEEKESFLDEP